MNHSIHYTWSERRHFSFFLFSFIIFDTLFISLPYLSLMYSKSSYRKDYFFFIQISGGFHDTEAFVNMYTDGYVLLKAEELLQGIRWSKLTANNAHALLERTAKRLTGFFWHQTPVQQISKVLDEPIHESISLPYRLCKCHKRDGKIDLDNY